MMCNTAELFSWTVIFAVESLVIIAGNIITIFVFWKLRSVLKKTYYLLINLTIADLTVGFGAIEILTINIYKLKTSEELKWRKFISLDVFSGCASLITLLLIAVERWYAVVCPFRHRALTRRIYINGIAWVWLMAVLATITSLVSKFFSNSVITVASPWIFTSVAAMVIITFCCVYTKIWISSRKDDPRIPRVKREQNKRLAKTLFIVTASSVVAWLPFAVTFVLPHYVKSHKNCSLRSLFDAARFMQLANSFLNPVIYCYRMPEFSRILKEGLLRSKNAKVNIRSAQITV
ncbi:beta-2 adrenergic receptor-like [Oculina patagonica]